MAIIKDREAGAPAEDPDNPMLLYNVACDFGSFQETPRLIVILERM